MEVSLFVARRHPKQELQDIFGRLIGCRPPGHLVFVDVHLPLAVLMQQALAQGELPVLGRTLVGKMKGALLRHS